MLKASSGRQLFLRILKHADGIVIKILERKFYVEENFMYVILEILFILALCVIENKIWANCSLRCFRFNVPIFVKNIKSINQQMFSEIQDCTLKGEGKVFKDVRDF